jgi:hypothetical protein
VNSGWLTRAAAAAVGAVLVGSLVATPAAGAAVTASNITTPSNPSYFIADRDATTQPFTISGTASGGNPATDKVDIRCYYGTSYVNVATNVPLGSGGSFSVSNGDLSVIRDRLCRLRAVPAGTAPSNVTPFNGPLVGVGERDSYKISTGPNNGKLYDYYIYAQQATAAFDYVSTGSCGMYDGYLFDSTLALTTVTFWCNAGLFSGYGTGATRSEAQVDGANAYLPWGARRINQDASGLPVVTYSYSVDPHTGNLVIHESDPVVKCADSTYPPTTTSCATFVPTGVTDYRTMTQDHDGHVCWITDVFKNTDGKKHSLDLQWDNFQRFHSSTGDSTQLAYEFPGQSTFATHATNDTVTLPAGAPRTILVKMNGAADGDTATGQGAIVYDRPATTAIFHNVATYAEDFTLQQKTTVPAGGSTTFRFAYVQDFHAANVASLARTATKAFTPCIVPQVTGKGFKAAKGKITHANCSVGKIKRAFSNHVKKGRVISQKPKAGKHLAAGAKVSLKLSKGKKK